MTDIELTVENIQEKQSFSLLAQNIVKARGRKLFAAAKALNCLAKSDTFFKELLNTFNKLFTLNITPEKFSFAVSKTQTSQTDKIRLEICADLYFSYVSIMEKNGLRIPLIPFAKIKKTKPFSTDFGKSLPKTIEKKYLEFADIQSESAYVIEKIKEAVENGTACYSDFAVFADKTEARQKFADLMKVAQIPVTSSIYNEDYESLKHKINIYEKISALRMQIEKNTLKSQTEILTEELDLTMKSLLEEEEEKTPEKIASEHSALKAFYGFYKQNDYAKAIESLIKRYFAKFENTDIKDIVAGKIKSLNELQKLYNTILEEKPDFASFKEIMEWLPQDKLKEKTHAGGAVRLGSISTELKENENFKVIFVSGLTENNFPGNNNSYPFVSLQTSGLLTIELQKINPDFDFFLKTDEIHFEQKYQALCSIIAHTPEQTGKIIFTTHTYEAKKSAQPSVFFKALADTDPENFEKINDTKTQAHSFESTAALGYTKADGQKVISDSDILKLNPSAISTFQQCKRKYYYKNLLNLKEDSTFAASYGNIVHAVFEVLNRRFLDSYNKETALALSKVLFDTENEENTENIEKAQRAGFKQTDIELVKATDALSLKEMKENFEAAIEDFNMMGYFDNPPKKAVCEKSFSFTLPQLPNVVFDGRIDAIITDSEGKNTVIDYKTGKNKINSLDYAVSEYGVNFKSKTGKDPANVETLQNNYDYQIPIYYLACQNSESLSGYKDNISKLGLLYIRPESKHDGCDDDFVPAEKIEFYKDKIIQNLKETVIDKIVNETEFKAQKSFNCEYCTYKFLCDGEGDDD